MIDKNKIVFASHSGITIDCNPKAIFNYLYKHTNFNFVWLVRKDDIQKYKEKYNDKRIKIVNYHSQEAVKEINSCLVFINNQLNIYFYKKGLKKNIDQLFINTWHGSFGLKFIPLMDDKEIIQNSLKDIDYFLSNSDFETNVYKNTFSKNINVLKIGHPRNDDIINKEIKRKVICQKLHLNDKKKIVSWLPTVRQTSYDNLFYLDVNLILQALKSKFGNDWYFCIRVHRNNLNIKNLIINKYDDVIDLSEYDSIADIITITDILITDYSSVICDYILTKKIAFIYAPDYDNYIRFSGFYHNLEDLPFGLARNSCELANNIINFNLNKYRDDLNIFLSKVGCIEDGKASEKICKIISEFAKGHLNTLLEYTNIITPYMAKLLNANYCYFSFRNLGDQLILQRAITIKSQRDKNPQVVCSLTPELWENYKNAYIIRVFERKLHCYDGEIFETLKSLNIQPVFLSQEKFNKINNKLVRTYGDNHIVANVLKKMGFSGKYVVDLDFQNKKYINLNINKKYICIMTGGLQKYKTYPFEKLQNVVDHLKNDYQFCQIGVLKDPLLKDVIDLREKISIPEVAGLMSNAFCFIGGIGGLMHLANSVKCPSIVLYTSAEPDYIVNYKSNINIHPSKDTCSLCTNGSWCPWTTKCPNINDKQYECIKNIKEIDVIQAIHYLENRKQRYIPTIVQINNKEKFEVKDDKDYFKTGFKYILNKEIKQTQPFISINYIKNLDNKCYQLKIKNYPISSLMIFKNFIKIRFFFINFRIKYTH